MPGYRIIVIGASAGGVEALTSLIKELPADFPAAIFIVLHIPSFGTSVLPQILTRCGALPAVHPHDRQEIQPGRIYIAPPNHHLLVQRGQIRLSVGPRENGHRPAVDTLFRSAAQTYRQRVIGVVLSGTLDDGTAGLAMIKARGGTTIAQDPKEALFDSMPRSAIEKVEVDHIFKLTEIAAFLQKCAEEPVEEEEMTEDELARELTIVSADKASMERGEQPDSASPLTCPECGGVLWELRNNNIIRFRCHTGHVYSSDSLVAEQAGDVERALWSANRALEEKAALARRMAVAAHEQNRSLSEAQFIQRAEEAEHHAALLRQVILQQSQDKALELDS